MKIFKNIFVFTFTTLVIFFISNFINSNLAFASIPILTECRLNNSLTDTNLNPNNSTISLDIFSDQAVKFNTIAICQDGDPVCSRSTAVKYFTYTSGYVLTVNKVWDGKTGGGNPVVVSDGLYKIRATLANQSGETNSPGDYCTPKINILFSGDNDDPDGVGTTTATTTIPVATTTATITATSTITTTTATTTVYVYSTHYIQDDVSTYVEPTVFAVSAGRERLGYIDLPLSFEVKSKKTGEIKDKNMKLTWSFGDGAFSTAEKVVHFYKYPGEYNVVLNASAGDYNSVSRTVVKILKPNILISNLENGGVEIFNKNNEEINLYGWKLKSNNLVYAFPQDTIISGNKSIVFPVEYLGFPIDSREVILVDGADKVLAQNNFTLINKNEVISVSDFEKFAMEYKRLTAPKSEEVLAVRPVKIQDPIIKSEDQKTISEMPMSAAVIDTPDFGFWSKVFHPIRTIKQAFY